MHTRTLRVPTPGEVLFYEFLEPMELSQHSLAEAIGVPQRIIGQIVKGDSSVTPDLAHRLGRYFGTTDTLWLDLQRRYDEAGINPPR